MAAAGEVLEKRLEGKRICICAGSGGVGKTTISAALALALARRGERVVVVTIDPARRLAGALGIAAGRAGSTGGRAARGAPVHVPLESGPGDGGLWALTLDVGATFDELLAELSPDEATRAAIRENRIYRELSTAVAGSQEIAAVAKLFELHRDGAFDVIVLDTPPAANALDFLDAPTRMAGFLEGRAMNMFLAAGAIAGGRTNARSQGSANGDLRDPRGMPSALGRLIPGSALPLVVPRSVAARLLGGSTALLLSLFARATGVEVVGDLAVFFRLLSGMSDSLRERSRAVEALLRDQSTTYLIVTSPEHEAAREAEFLHRHLAELSMPYGALIVNRVHDGAMGERGQTSAPGELEELLVPPLGPRLAARVLRNLADVEVLVRRDRDSLARLSRAVREPEPVCVPQMGADIDSLAGLSAVGARLLG